MAKSGPLTCANASGLERAEFLSSGTVCAMNAPVL